MSSLFSSPSKGAQSASNAVGGISSGDITSAENYVNTSEGQLRGAIAQLGDNPYVNAANGATPSSGGQVNPRDTVQFSAPTPPTGIPAPGTPAPQQGGNPFSPIPPGGAPGNNLARQPLPIARGMPTG